MSRPQGETQQTALVLLALIVVLGISYLLFTLAIKLFGIVLFLVGAWLLVGFPSIPAYQPGKFVDTTRIVGLLFIIVGLMLAIFW